MKTRDYWNMACPQCGHDDKIDIEAKVWFRLTYDGADFDGAENKDSEWNSDSAAICHGCGYDGSVADFYLHDTEAEQQSSVDAATNAELNVSLPVVAATDLHAAEVTAKSLKLSPQTFEQIVKQAQDVQKANPYGSEPHRAAYNRIRRAVLIFKGFDIGEYI